jgi:PAS domain S-box-containing protein
MNVADQQEALATMPPPGDEVARLAALRQYQSLDGGPDHDLDDLAHLAASVCGAPIAVIGLVDERRVWFKSRLGLAVEEIPRDASFCAQAILQSDLLIVPDALADHRFLHSPLVTSGPRARFYAGAPLVTSEGYAIGTIAVLDLAPRELAPAAQDALRKLARQVMSQLELKRRLAELQEANGKLAQAHYFLNSLMESAPDYIYFKDRASRFLRISRSEAEHLGLSDPAQAVGLTDFDFFTDEHAQQAYEDEQMVMRTGQPMVGKEEKETWPDGSITWALTTKMPLYDRDGHIVGTFGLSSNITARKVAEEELRTVYAELERRVTERTAELLKANARLLEERSERERTEEALRRSKERYRELLENANDIIYTHDLSGNFTSLNKMGEKITGYTREEARQLNLAQIVAPEYVDLSRQMIAHKLSGHNPATYELEIIARDGRRVALEVSTRLIYEGDQPIEVQGIARDVTFRKRAEKALRASEERYRAFVENSSEAIWRFEVDRPIPVTLPEDEQIELFYQHGYLAECNDAMAQLYGFPRASDLVGTRLADLLVRTNPGNVEYLRSFIRAGYRLTDAETVEVDKSGNQKYFLNNLVGIIDEGFLWRAWGTSRDVTSRKLAEKALRDSEAQLRQSQKMEAVGRLAGGVAHDFNNLLTAITGYSALMLRRLRQADPLRYQAEEIKRAADRAASLTRQLLAVSRNQVLQPRVLDLNEVVSGMDNMLQRLIGEDIELQSVLAPNLGRVKADPGQIEQVILNLVVNARDAMPEGGKLIIETANIVAPDPPGSKNLIARDARYVMLAVTDTGCGMDAETQSHIFEPFFTTKEIGKGTGLGLSTVYGIVKQSGGHISVCSAVGRGTTFKIYLPLIEDQVEEIRPGSDSDMPRGNESLLLVEDEEIVRQMMREILEMSGYQVLEAASGPEALAICQRHEGPIHAVITDVVMPRMSGRELAERLRQLRPQTKVVYMSGYTDDAIVRHGVLDEGVTFIQKPFTPEAVARKVRQALDAQKAASDR